MITTKIVNGKQQITACTLANCCLTVIELETDPTQLRLSNEKGEKLTCSLDEFKEVAEYLSTKNNKMKTLIQFNFNNGEDCYLIKTETENNKKYEPCKKKLIEVIRLIYNLEEDVLVEDVNLSTNDFHLTARIIYPDKKEEIVDIIYSAKLVTIFD